jgi:hypothetical protein
MAYIKFNKLTKTDTITKEVGDIYKLTLCGSNMRFLGYVFYMVDSILEDGRHMAKKLIKKGDRFNVSTSKPVFMTNTVSDSGAVKVWRINA